MNTSQPAASILKLAGGRQLGYCEYGDPNGTPIFGFHGTPGSRLQLAPPKSSPLPAGYRLIVPDRPGYGCSTFYPERRLIDWPGDVAALADHLGIERFAAMGVSGGGPHVLVCAHALAPRLLGVACVSSVGPLYDPAAKEGMMPLNRMLTTLSRRSPWLLSWLFRYQFSSMAKDPEAALEVLLKQLPEVDREILRDPDFKASFIADFMNASATWHLAAAQDFRLFARDWGFRLADIAVPVHFWQGSLDRNVPATHARLLVRAMQHATLHLYEGEGHLLVVKRLPEILRTIT